MNLMSALHGADPVLGLVPDPDHQHVGYVFRMGYDSALVLTNDAWRDRVAGLPLGCLLAASEIEFSDPGSHDPASASAVILRVTGSAKLPMDDDALRTVIEMHTRRTSRQRVDEHDGYDGMTHAELQWGGLECRILGTLYNRDGQTYLGADVEDFPAAVQSRVFKLRGEGLSSVVNFLDPIRQAKAVKEAADLGFKTLPLPVEIGNVRYTSADRLHRTSGADVVVNIQPFDLLARRTAVFGMTRTGKSNTTKTIVSEIALAAARGGQKVGQLIFDMNGEYANATHQDDGSSLADAFGTDNENAIVRYRGRDAQGFRDLRPNFYDDFERSLAMLQGLAGADPHAGASQEFQTFLTLTIPTPEPSDWPGQRRFEVKKALFHALLAKAKFDPPPHFKIKFATSKAVVDAVGQSLLSGGTAADWMAAAGGTKGTNAINCSMTPDDAVAWFEAAWNVQSALQSGPGKPWLDSDAVILIDMLAGKSTNRSGATITSYRVIERQRAYHSARGTADVAADVYKELKQGKIVILDLSVGTESVREALAEQIAKFVFNANMEAFHSGGTPPNLVLYVEEAHNLIGADAKPDDTWPRIAKEGAKARIALVYATQEPSSIQRNIMANTENVFCTHLNNDDEIRTLSKYYDFSDFAASIKKAQDVGFARMKTLSAPFVVPTQIRKFEPSVVRDKWLEATGQKK
jgi:hypothetical protein